MMSNPFELNDPFSTVCETCGMRDCFGHDETQRSIRLIPAIIAIVIVIALVAGSFGFLLGANSEKDVVVTPTFLIDDSPSTTTQDTDAPAEVAIAPEEQEMLDLVNEERTRESLAPVTWCPALARSATDHSQDMALKNYFEHESLDGREVSDRAEAQGYDYRTVGENIAVGQRDVEEVMQGWMDSPGHRENILRPEYTHLGSGVATGDFKGQRSIYWTQNFGAGGNCQ
jgi:uncharacterized protein YkwD